MEIFFFWLYIQEYIFKKILYCLKCMFEIINLKSLNVTWISLIISVMIHQENNCKCYSFFCTN